MQIAVTVEMPQPLLGFLLQSLLFFFILLIYAYYLQFDDAMIRLDMPALKCVQGVRLLIVSLLCSALLWTAYKSIVIKYINRICMANRLLVGSVACGKFNLHDTDFASSCSSS